VYLVSSSSSKERDAFVDRMLLASHQRILVSACLSKFENSSDAFEGVDSIPLPEQLTGRPFLKVPYSSFMEKRDFFSYSGLLELFANYLETSQLLSCSSCGEKINSSKDEVTTSLTIQSGNCDIYIGIRFDVFPVSYDDLKAWMEEIPSTVLFIEGRGRFRLHDPIFKLLLDELESDEFVYAFMDTCISLEGLNQYVEKRRFENCTYRYFYSVDLGFSWISVQGKKSCPNCDEFKSDFSISDWKIFLTHSMNSTVSIPLRFEMPLSMDGDPSSLGEVELSFLLSLQVRTFYNIFSKFLILENNSNGARLIDAFNRLIRFDFGEVYLTDTLSTFTPSRSTLLSFINALTFSPKLIIKVLSSVLSGYPLHIRELIFDEIKKEELSGHDFILVDEEKSFKESELLDVIRLSSFYVKTSCEEVLPIDGDLRDIYRPLMPKKSLLLESEDREPPDSSFVLDFDVISQLGRRHATSTFGTFTGFLSLFRSMYSEHPLSKLRGYTDSSFSFSSKDALCHVCFGSGLMEFRSGVTDVCSRCKGSRLSDQVNEIQIDSISFGDLITKPLSDIEGVFSERVKLSNIFSQVKMLRLIDLSLGTPLHNLHYSEYRRAVILRYSSQLSKVDSLIYIKNLFRGLSYEEGKAICEFLHSVVSPSSTVMLTDYAEYLHEFCDNAI